MTAKEILLALAAPTLAGAIAFLVTFPGTEPSSTRAVQANVSSLPQDSINDSRSTSNKKNSGDDWLSSGDFTPSVSSSSTNASDLTTKVYPSREAALAELASKPQLQFQTEEEAPQPRLPLIFLNQANVLPQTEETAAAVRNLQQNFIDSTGAANADPADPDYADRWNRFQPSADDIFYAIFGSEAYNALSIMEARRSGHL